MTILYIAYDGMLEPLGQSQVLSYQERLVTPESPVHLLSFEKEADWKDKESKDSVSERIAKSGIQWHPCRYHKRPSALATAWDIIVGIVKGIRIVRRHNVNIVHARSYVPAVIALVLKRMTGVKFIFDMRGFWADERVDGGLWPRDGRMYKVAKWFERRFLLEADHVVSLTEAAVQVMQTFPYLEGRFPTISVIPTCADLSRFHPQGRQREGFVLGYVGSAGTWYLFDAVVSCFKELHRRRRDARLLVVNRHEHDYIRERVLAGGVPIEAVEIRAVQHCDVPEQLARMHIGIFFIKPVFSKQASAPTKLGEFLGCGIPCLSNRGVGDMAQILEGDRVGVALGDFDVESIRTGLDSLLTLVQEPGITQRCVESARRHFSLEEGVERYRQVYATLAGDL